MTASPEPNPPGRFRQTLIRVMIVQVLALLGLWFIQSRYHG